jgi:alkylhydroperoxidase family enzyme
MRPERRTRDSLPRLLDVEWLDPLVERERNRELERYVKQEAGRVPPHTRYFGACPWIMRADIDFDIGCEHIGRLADLIYLTVSRDNSCRFCYGGARLFMRMAGMSEAQIELLEQEVETARLEPRVLRALDFARRVSRSNPPPGDAERKELLDHGYGEAAIRELALFAGVVIFHNRVNTLLALPPRTAERIAHSWWGGLLRFQFRTALRRLASAPEPALRVAEADSGPYAGLTNALGALPHARVLRRTLDAAWASPHLPPRARALIFAVIARGLGSAGAEREACRLLVAEGMAQDEIAASLANLASPELDATEARILPYVRETIWYQPAAVQRRGRALGEQLGHAVLLETVGVAALANMVCRIALAVDET